CRDRLGIGHVAADGQRRSAVLPYPSCDTSGGGGVEIDDGDGGPVIGKPSAYDRPDDARTPRHDGDLARQVETISHIYAACRSAISISTMRKSSSLSISIDRSSGISKRIVSCPMAESGPTINE